MRTSSEGAPLAHEFRDAITELAKQAREDDRRSEEQVRKRTARQPLSAVIKFGLVLVALESITFSFLWTNRQHDVNRIAPPIRALSQNDCLGIAHRTYWKVVAYIKDEARAPARLEDLIPKYLDKRPFDPSTGKPLEYAANGTTFDLRCPSGAAGE
ncbi:MAG: hypothetical protein ACREQQ_12025 [Candidatus Binatia bacterium]